jgi:hypothetical protein
MTILVCHPCRFGHLTPTQDGLIAPMFVFYGFVFVKRSLTFLQKSRKYWEVHSIHYRCAFNILTSFRHGNSLSAFSQLFPFQTAQCSKAAAGALQQRRSCSLIRTSTVIFELRPHLRSGHFTHDIIAIFSKGSLRARRRMLLRMLSALRQIASEELSASVFDFLHLLQLSRVSFVCRHTETLFVVKNKNNKSLEKGSRCARSSFTDFSCQLRTHTLNTSLFSNVIPKISLKNIWHPVIQILSA